MTDWVVDLANHVRSNFPDWAQNVFAYQLPEGAPDPSIVIAPVIEGIPYDVEYPDRYRGPYRAIVTTKDIALAHNLGEEVLRMLTIFGTQMGGTEIIRSFPTNTPVVYPKAASDLYEVMVMLEVILIDRRIRTGADLVGTGLLTMGSFSLNGQSVTSISGNVNITMGNFTLTAEDLASTGSGDSTLDDFTLNGVSKLAITAALNEGMDSFSMSATGAHGSFPGSLISSLNSFSMNAAGTTLIEMSGGYTLDDFTISGGGLPGITAVAAVSLDDFTADGIASTFFPANGLVIMDDFSASGSGVITISGSAGVTLGDFTLTTATNLPISGALNQNFPALTLAGVSPMTIEGDLVSVMGDFTLSAVGINTKVGDLSSTLDDFTLTGTANTAISGFVVFDFDPFTLSGSINSEASGSAITTMDDFSLSGIGILKLTGDATSIPMDDFVVSGVADPSLIDASAVVTLGEFSILSSANSDVSGFSIVSMDDFTTNGSSFTEVEASANVMMDDFEVTSSDSNSSISSTAVISMANFSVSALGNLAIPGSTIAALGEFNVTASAATTVSANATMVMGEVTIVSSGGSEITGSATATLDTFAINASGTIAGNEAETDTLLAQMTTAPTAAREANINTLIKNLKDDGLWSKMDLLYVLSAHDAQSSLLNWVNPTSFTATNNASTFSADWGYGENSGNSPDSPPGLSTGWNSQTNGSQFTDSSMHIGVWGRAVAGREYFKMGTIEMQCGGTLTTGDNTINFGGTSDTTDANTNSLDGYKLMSANYNAGGDDIGRFYHNGVEAAASPPTITSGFIENAEMQLITRFNNGGNAGVRIFHLGAELTAAEVANLYTHFSTYLTAIQNEGTEAETDALIAQMSSAPDATRQGHINTLIKSMKDAGVWTKLGWFSIIGHDQDASLKNWIVPTEDLQMLNNPVVVADTYFDSKSTTGGNGAFRAGTGDDGGAALADVTFGCYFVKLDESGQSRAARLTDNQTWFRCDFSPPSLKMTGGSNFRNNYATYVITADYHVTGVHRGTGASDREGYYNGVSYDTKTGSGGSLSATADLDLFGTSAKNSDERYICGYWGTALTSQEVSDLHDAIEVYKTAIGA